VTVQDLGSLGELIAAVATIATLVYLAIQIRQNTRSVRAATHHSLTTSVHALHGMVANNESLAHIYFTGSRDRKALQPEERLRFDALLRSVFLWYEDFFYQNQQGMVDGQTWRAREEELLALLSRPGIAEWWPRNSVLLSENFRAHVDEQFTRR
jgi:hypothetical protein